MKHEFKQGDEVEYKISQPEKWKKATYIGFHAGKHVIGFENGRIDEVYEWEMDKIRHIKKRWRAKEGENYYCLDTCFEVIRALEDGGYTDSKRYECGNYFQTKEQAEQAAELIKQILKKFHESLE